MIEFDNSHRVLLVLLSTVIIASGCVQNSSTNLNSDFNLDYEEINLNSSGQAIYESAMSKIDNITAYSVEADNKMAMNLPVISVSVNMTSEGDFQSTSSEINSSGIIGFDFGGNFNATEFNTQIETTENGTVTTTEMASDRNQSETERYSREELGISLEALENIDVTNASVLGSTQLDGEENILLELEVNSIDLMTNSESIFEVHSPIQESVDGEAEMSEAPNFNEIEAYLWTGRENSMPSKFAYYGSASNGSLQVRSVTQYSEK